jgi:hypothetical protein
MEYSKNPFTPTFGSVPPFLAGREHILRDINRGFINGPGDPNLSTIFTGARGTGKTALLSLLSETALEHGWMQRMSPPCPACSKILSSEPKKPQIATSHSLTRA